MPSVTACKTEREGGDRRWSSQGSFFLGGGLVPAAVGGKGGGGGEGRQKQQQGGGRQRGPPTPETRTAQAGAPPLDCLALTFVQTSESRSRTKTSLSFLFSSLLPPNTTSRFLSGS